MRLLPMLAPMAQKIVRVDAHHQDGRRRVWSDRIEVSAEAARGASKRIDGSPSRDSGRPDLPRDQHISSRDVARELDRTAPSYDLRLDTVDAQGFISRTLPSSARLDTTMRGPGETQAARLDACVR